MTKHACMLCRDALFTQLLDAGHATSHLVTLPAAPMQDADNLIVQPDAGPESCLTVPVSSWCS